MVKYINYFFYSLNKKLSYGIRPKSGRNFSGKICVHHKSGGNKNKFYYIDYFRRINQYGFIYKIIKNTEKTAYLGGIIYENGLFSYILLTEKLKIGDKIYSGDKLTNINIIDRGFTIPISNIGLFSIVNNIEIYPYSGGSLTRAAGTSSIITSIKTNNANIKLKSGWFITISKYCIATLGNLSNVKHKLDKLIKQVNQEL